jgi:hypothetical protein
MKDFDRRLEAELAQMLDRVVRTPPPPRRRPRGRPALRLLSALTTPVAPPPPAALLAEASDVRVDTIALAEVPAVVAPALIY